MLLPKVFEDNTRRIMGDELYETFRCALDVPSPVSIRLNPQMLKEGAWHVEDGERIPWSQYGYYLKERPNFTFDPLLHAGCYYVQEASSMFMEHVLRTLLHHPSPISSLPSGRLGGGLTVLDLCAAPGGKSTCTAAILPEGSILYSNEPIRQRAQVLSENLQKWQLPTLLPSPSPREGRGGVVPFLITNSYARDYRKAGIAFDMIIADVPCSGEGMFRKDEGAVKEWSPENVEHCWQLQREIISDIWPCLRPCGFLIYSTCTFNTLENEENVKWICEELGAEFVEIPIEKDWQITGSLLPGFNAPVYRFIPGRTRGEGLFMAVLKKKEDPTPTPSPKGKGRNSGKEMLNTMEQEFLQEMQSAAGEPRVEVDYRQAISYLRREALVLPPETPRGTVIITFRGFPLGLAKNIGTRANNQYPKEWRIKSTYIPENYEAILRHTEQNPD